MKGVMFSVVTPSLNQGDYIEENILSVKNQDYSHKEHIIVDGGSSDNTVAILKKYKNLRWVSEKDRGQSHALNKGFRMAKGDIICWINSDDQLGKEALQIAAGFFEKNPHDKAVTGSMQNIDSKGAYLSLFRSREYTFENLLNENKDIRQSATFFRQEVIEEVGNLREDLHYAMDYEFFLRMTESFTIKNIPDTLSIFRRHGMSKTRSNDYYMLKEQQKVREAFKGRRWSPAGRVLAWNLFKAYVKLFLGDKNCRALSKVSGIRAWGGNLEN